MVDSDIFVYCHKTHIDIMEIVNKKHETGTGFLNWLEKTSLGEFIYFIRSCENLKVAGMNRIQWLDYCKKFEDEQALKV